MKKNKPLIYNIIEGSIADEAGIENGDIILSINGNEIWDIFDYQYNTSVEQLLIVVEKTCGELLEVEIEKDEEEDLGIEFENPLIDKEKSCNNKCIFCFVDQLPKGLRKSLYYKDDDSRLSFLSGNYITTTNMEDSDIQRIIDYRMSPVNISVHSTDPELRCLMLNNKNAGNIKDRIKKLSAGRIKINTQIVVCRGINDGKELINTITELSTYYPWVQSISAVPSGLTKYREGLYKLRAHDSKSSEQIIKNIEDLQKQFMYKYGSRIVYAADEFYIMSGMKIPNYNEYEDFYQLENGIGMVSLFENEFIKAFNEYSCYNKTDNKVKLSIVTGCSSYNFIKQLTEYFCSKFVNHCIEVFQVINNFFGHNITVTGLLTGKDIIEQLKGQDLGDRLLISDNLLRHSTDILLDDYTVTKIKDELQVEISIVKNNGKDFFNELAGGAICQFQQ